MHKNRFSSHQWKFWALSLGFLLVCTTPAYAQTILNLKTQVFYQQEEVIQKIAQSKVIYLGETHDSLQDHQLQLEIIQKLHQQNPKLAIGMEMFQRPYQEFINQYLAGKITESQLIAKTEYEQRWGFPWEYYAPILRFAKENNLPVIALNTPREVTRKVAKSGLNSLTDAEKKWIPPLEQIELTNSAYREMIESVFKGHQTSGHGSSLNLDNFFAAQVLWDETMAEAITEFLHQNPQHQVVVLAGKGHIEYGYGIPDRVSRRFNHNLTQTTILLNSHPEKSTSQGVPAADYFWSRSSLNL